MSFQTFQDHLFCICLLGDSYVPGTVVLGTGDMTMAIEMDMVPGLSLSEPNIIGHNYTIINHSWDTEVKEYHALRIYKGVRSEGEKMEESLL